MGRPDQRNERGSRRGLSGPDRHGSDDGAAAGRRIEPGIGLCRGAGGLYPYLASFYPNGAQAISGIGYQDAGAHALSSGVGSVYTVSGLVNGGVPVTATTGANGYYYLLEPAGTIAATGSPVLVYTANGASFTSAATGTVNGLDVWGGWLRETTGETTLSSTQGLMAQAIGANADVSSLVGGLTDIAIDASAPSFAFDQSINANILDVTANNASQTSGVITAAILNLSGGAFTLGEVTRLARCPLGWCNRADRWQLVERCRQRSYRHG